MSSAASPFSPQAVIGLIVGGFILFVLLLWMMGTGAGGGSTNDGGAHVGGRGLNGYAALASFAEKRGYSVTRSRNEGGLKKPGILVLTPPHMIDAEDVNKIISQRRYVGPTLIILPKWLAAPVSANAPNARKGWVTLAGARAPNWHGVLDDVSISLDRDGKRTSSTWSSHNLSGPLPQNTQILSGWGKRVVPLVETGDSGRTLAGYVADNGYYPRLEAVALKDPAELGEDEERYPIVIVFEPDLLNNYGMNNPANAQLAAELFAAMDDDKSKSISFDLTQNGHGRSTNLLTLAFTPPFLAATICLLIAAVAAGWRALIRFGPPRTADRAIAFGKRTLVSNSAGLIRRSHRLYLIAAPYADAARDRLARALGLPRMTDAHATEEAIDRALAARDPNAPTFSQISANLRSARRADDMVKAAREIHSLERKLTR